MILMSLNIDFIDIFMVPQRGFSWMTAISAPIRSKCEALTAYEPRQQFQVTKRIDQLS